MWGICFVYLDLADTKGFGRRCFACAGSEAARARLPIIVFIAHQHRGVPKGGPATTAPGVEANAGSAYATERLMSDPICMYDSLNSNFERDIRPWR
jgi:hypothetical protein